MTDHDRIEGSAKHMKGEMKEGVGKLTGDEKLKAEGRAEEFEGKVQNTVGGIKDAVKDDRH
ncbi:CsbD family protein [Brevundimonas sp. 2R-24]|uniref:CsbD family protein n=1 Tax=Peiella sedimenti TaxID=3061083 RepID=A0ABT8SL64_9CAUL|nr:CsbD family protein [Caulobacteraceae bacterium XZ-24]